MSDINNENEPIIRVKDRRMFNADGSLRTPDALDEDDERAATMAEEATSETTSKTASAPATEAAEATAESPLEAAPADEDDLAADDAAPERPGQPSLFSDFVVNLASQAAMYMGLVNDPLGPQFPTDLGAARQMLDILGMLQSKTKGNLTSEEAVLLERILTDLRMQYVAMAAPRR